jgi:signal transduction histidine kinase
LEGSGIMVEVADTGIGIGMEALDKNFDPFEQGNRTWRAAMAAWG